METELYKEIKVTSSQRNKIYTGDKKHTREYQQ